MKNIISPDAVEKIIYLIRGQKVILDCDLAAIYGVSTRRLNEQVKRNKDKFPDDFTFRLTPREAADFAAQIEKTAQPMMRSRFAIAYKRNLRFPPHVFTEHGAIMAANVLNSPLASRKSVFVVRAFIRMRQVLSGNRELSEKLKRLEKMLTARLDIHEKAIFQTLEQLMRLLNPETENTDPEEPQKRIGFTARERRAEYLSATRNIKRHNICRGRPENIRECLFFVPKSKRQDAVAVMM